MEHRFFFMHLSWLISSFCRSISKHQKSCTALDHESSPNFFGFFYFFRRDKNVLSVHRVLMLQLLMAADKRPSSLIFQACLSPMIFQACQCLIIGKLGLGNELIIVIVSKVINNLVNPSQSVQVTLLRFSFLPSILQSFIYLDHPLIYNGVFVWGISVKHLMLTFLACSLGLWMSHWGPCRTSHANLPILVLLAYETFV